MSLRAEPAPLADHIRQSELALRGAGIESSRHDAERLAAHALGVSWGELWTRLREPFVSADALRGLVRRRCAGEPLGYILGSVVFSGFDIECGPGVLVPRPETETLVEVGLELIADRPAPIVVDIGTGTGAAAIAIARARPDALVTATDISEEALVYATRNAERLGARIAIVRGDLFDALDGTLIGRTDLVVSNPPYVAETTTLPRDVESEPRVALRAGPRGDEVLLRIVERSPDVLAPDGALAVEVGTPSQAELIEGRLQHAYSRTGIRTDHTDRPRVVWGTR